MKPIRFITFEGPEGGGKTTQALHLSNYIMQNFGRPVFVTRQPGGDPVGVKLREILLQSNEAHIEPEAELLMMMADRAQSVAKIIKPSLELGHIVICDRYIDSSVAYQGYGRGLSIEMIQTLNDFATGGIVPDLTFLLNVDPAIGLSRQSNITRMEEESLAFHQRVTNGFLKIASDNPDRFVVIDASRPIEHVEAKICSEFALRCSQGT